MSVSQHAASLMRYAKLRNNLAGHTGICQQVGFIRALFGKHDCTASGAGRWGMSDAIQQAIEAMDMARSAVGPFGVVVTRKLTESIEALQALQIGKPVVPEGYVLVPKTALDGALYLAGLAVAHTDFGSQHRADFKVCCDALLSAGKETI
jgi:hypothetical protein